MWLAKGCTNALTSNPNETKERERDACNDSSIKIVTVLFLEFLVKSWNFNEICDSRAYLGARVALKTSECKMFLCYINMQRPSTRICIRSHRMIHADGSLGKWSALHPRAESIARSASCLSRDNASFYSRMANFRLKGPMYTPLRFFGFHSKKEVPTFVFHLKKGYLPATPEETSPWRKTCRSPSQQTFGISVPLTRELQWNLPCGSILLYSVETSIFDVSIRDQFLYN